MSSILRDRIYCTILTEEREEGMHSDVCTNNSERLWKNAVILFVFNHNVTDDSKNDMRRAMENLSSVSIVKFVEIKHETALTLRPDYIEIIDKGEFASFVGRRGVGRQELRVSSNSEWLNHMGHAMHELMHVLGFYHEHARPDRDQILDVRSSDINYRRQLESDTVCYGPHDFESIMHYSLSPLMTLRQEIKAEIGQRERLSDGDISALNKLYPRNDLWEEQERYLNLLHMLDGTINLF